MAEQLDTPEQSTGDGKNSKLTEDLKVIVAKQNEQKTQDISHPETDEFIDWISTKGVQMPDTESARAALNDPDLFNMPLRPLLDKLGMTMEDARAVGMPLKSEITKVTGARFKEFIANTDWQSRLVTENLQVEDSASTSEFTEQQVHDELEKILSSTDMQFAQGAVWNMVTTESSHWVAKFKKSTEGSSSPEWAMQNQMEQYRELVDVFGADIMLEQVAVHLKDKGTPILLQKKLDLSEWQAMGSFNENVEEQVQGAMRANPDNPAILLDFLERIKLLESSKGLVLDFSGDNVVFQLDEKGRLDIKIIDYGCTKLESEDPQRLAHLHAHEGALRALVS